MTTVNKEIPFAGPDNELTDHRGSDSIFKPDSPCIGMCSTSYGDSVCRGCGRNSSEVVEWIGYSVEKKQEIWDRVTKEGTAVRFRKNK